ncbi:ferredoxin (plasmid) [Pseudonocardia sp. EC080610-09]|uniref:Rieske (2Fe-2S) protein n=1 Tax=unclassified Pseudonocardia TaxID=2619320 RepID=UPI0007057549|nr:MULTISPECIES: non-heme iron oxygenase ferredoxin subunit [unclassified Pseudonocardia]ALL79306.1 ferredoxin [Pseudonocardia sp. EC080610-09]ALL85277.1 ferredoxin [Pseudonocardia sp. EC080619-01]
MTLHFACRRDDLEVGGALTVKIEGIEPIALFRTEDGEIHATSDTCTHERWSLGEDSDFDGVEEVTCPLHMARFNVRTGEALCFPAAFPLTTYRTEVGVDGGVYLEI